MSATPRRLIKFANGVFGSLRDRLLHDLTNEAFAVLLCKTETIDNFHVIKVISVRYPSQEDYESRSCAHIRLNKAYVHGILCEVVERSDVDTIIDVHTHPFASSGVNFSGIDDSDELEFGQFLTDRFEEIRYGSVVLSRSDYCARMWEESSGELCSIRASIRTQTKPEAWPSSETTVIAPRKPSVAEKPSSSGMNLRLFDRALAVLGVEVIRELMADQKIIVVGAGGLGSLLAENLIQMGFHQLVIVDPDIVEESNVSRLAGASLKDAVKKRPKVAVLKRHLSKINPNAKIIALNTTIQEAACDKLVADADWIMLATDNHSSRFHVQNLSLKYFTPLLSLGVNITADAGRIEDMSGEVITIKIGDKFCLNCIGRINPIKMAAETHPDDSIRDSLVQKGYVRGADVKEPAVKTLNAIISAMACDRLINEFTERQNGESILVYENNHQPRIYSDHGSLQDRNLDCFSCNIVDIPFPKDVEYGHGGLEPDSRRCTGGGETDGPDDVGGEVRGTADGNKELVAGDETVGGDVKIR